MFQNIKVVQFERRLLRDKGKQKRGEKEKGKRERG